MSETLKQNPKENEPALITILTPQNPSDLYIPGDEVQGVVWGQLLIVQVDCSLAGYAGDLL